MYFWVIVFVYVSHAGMWEQWDTIVYPKEVATFYGTKVASESFIDLIAQTFWEFSSVVEMSKLIADDDPENQKLADERCLLTYLQSHQDRLLLCDVSSSAGVSQIVHTIQRIFEQLQFRKVGILSGDRSYFTKKKINSSQTISVVIKILCSMHAWITYNFGLTHLQVMRDWVMDIVYSLQKKLVQCHVDGRHVDDAFLVSAIAVLCIADRTITLARLSEQNCVQMSNLLRESYRPDRKQKACSALYALEQNLSTSQFRYNHNMVYLHISCMNTYIVIYNLCVYRKSVAIAALKNLALLILYKSNCKNWRWIETVPLYHFLSNQSVPFETVPINNPITWGCWPELEKARKKQFHDRLFSNTYIIDYIHYFAYCIDATAV